MTDCRLGTSSNWITNKRVKEKVKKQGKWECRREEEKLNHYQTSEEVETLTRVLSSLTTGRVCVFPIWSAFVFVDSWRTSSNLCTFSALRNVKQQHWTAICKHEASPVESRLHIVPWNYSKQSGLDLCLVLPAKCMMMLIRCLNSMKMLKPTVINSGFISRVFIKCEVNFPVFNLAN